MAEKRTMTLNLTQGEMELLEALATRKELSKTAVLRQALRLYQIVDDRVSGGARLVFQDDKSKRHSELVVL